MKFRLSKSIASLICFTLITVAIQSNEAAWANRDLLKPRESANTEMQEPVANGTEGIEFTALTPDKPIEIPKEGKLTTIKLGLRITNNSLVEREILLSPGLPVFFSVSQHPKRIAAGCDSSVIRLLTREKFGKILKPGESVEIFDEPIHLYQKSGEVLISYPTTNGMVCSFSGFQPGHYSIVINHDGFMTDLVDPLLWKRRVSSSPGELILSKTN
jgi:hypothetical protein